MSKFSGFDNLDNIEEIANNLLATLTGKPAGEATNGLIVALLTVIFHTGEPLGRVVEKLEGIGPLPPDSSTDLLVDYVNDAIDYN